MRVRLANSIGLIFFVLLVVYFFELMDYDKNVNPDIFNYITNYTNKNWSYDLGFEYYQFFLRDLIGLDFNVFWLSSLILMAFLYILNTATKLIQIPFAIINYFFLAEAFGTQVRYFIAALFFVFSLHYLKNYYRIAGMLIASVFHYGIALLFLNFTITGSIEKNKNKIAKNPLAIFVSIFIFYFVSIVIVNYVLPYTRFHYYAGSFYMESKSLSSLIYIFASFCILYYFSLKNEINLIFAYSLLLLYVVLCTSAIAVLSGRLFLVYLILEPLVSRFVYMKNKRLYFLLLLISLTKIIPLMIEFYYKNF